MAKIIDGKALAQTIRGNLKNEVVDLKKEGINPKLAVIMVGDDKASQIYVKNKSKACEEIGIEYEEFFLNADTTMDELLGLVKFSVSYPATLKSKGSLALPKKSIIDCIPSFVGGLVAEPKSK